MIFWIKMTILNSLESVHQIWCKSDLIYTFISHSLKVTISFMLCHCTHSDESDEEHEET